MLFYISTRCSHMFLWVLQRINFNLPNHKAFISKGWNIYVNTKSCSIRSRIYILKVPSIYWVQYIHLDKYYITSHRCESWAIKKAEHQRTDAFTLWCWRRLWRVPWTVRSSNQSILKEINPEYSLEGLILKLKFQNFGHLMRRANSLEKILMLRKTEGRRRRGWQRMR